MEKLQKHFRSLKTTSPQDKIWTPPKQEFQYTLFTPDCPNITQLSSYTFRFKPTNGSFRMLQLWRGHQEKRVYQQRNYIHKKTASRLSEIIQQYTEARQPTLKTRDRELDQYTLWASSRRWGFTEFCATILVL